METYSHHEEQEVHFCEECGEWVITPDEYGGDYFCGDCFKSLFTECAECGEYHKTEDMEKTGNGLVCDDCFSDYYTVCDKCGDVVHQDDSHWFDDNSLCEDCYDDNVVTCSNRRCSHEMWKEDAREHDGDYYCSDCFHDRFSTCDCCGEIVSSDFICYSESQDEYLCDSCYSDRDNSNIHDYCHKPSPVFHKTANDKAKRLYMGVENEVEDCRDVAGTLVYDLSEDESLFYLKDDASLNDGFEVVTHPATLDFHMNHMPWEQMLSMMKDEGGKSHDTRTCGLHVHLSRSFFTVSEVTRLSAFVNIQEDFFSAMARRNSEQWSKYKGKTKCNHYRHSAERYEAVNLCNRNTIELRIFKGTLNLQTLRATLQLCHALSHWVKTQSIASIVQRPEESLSLFKAYIRENSSLYSDLTSYMERKGE